MKKILSGCIAVWVIAVVLAPVSYMGAQDNGNVKERAGRTGAARENFCERLSERGLAILQRLDQREETTQGKRKLQAQEFQERASAFNERRTAWREEHDARFESRIRELSARADTDEKQAASATFQAAVAAAKEEKLEAMENARSVFRVAVADVLLVRKSAVDSAHSAREEGLQSALEQAQVGCAGDGNVEATVQELRNELGSVRAAFKDAIAAARETAREAHAVAVAAKREAFVSTAQADFQAALESARDALKAAWGAGGDESEGEESGE